MLNVERKYSVLNIQTLDAVVEKGAYFDDLTLTPHWFTVEFNNGNKYAIGTKEERVLLFENSQDGNYGAPIETLPFDDFIKNITTESHEEILRILAGMNSSY